MPEQVRLVVWDLDETFWKGTLVKGPITQIPANISLIKELAQRGIMSSICSRNDRDRVKQILEAEGLWEYFILPSINWDPKGPRVQALIESVQLRPASILFLDDNPANLEEARYFSPEIQTADVTFVPSLLEDPRFAGSPDHELSRLQHYKTLEEREIEKSTSHGSVEDFLRQSNIRVEILYDFDDQIDRIVELINRTNQLNFTKLRLPEDPVSAREQIAIQLRSHDIQAGLVRVIDNYGDHGLCGFYLLQNDNALRHFCFSCRILGMGVETWLYRRLGRPRLSISGEVLSDPTKDPRNVDWIGLGNPTTSTTASQPRRHQFDWVAARGGCDLQALSHYFQIDNSQVVGEFNVGRHGFDARVDHSIFLRYAIEGLSEEAIRESAKIGYRPEDFQSALFTPRSGNGIVILSFWADISYALYRHRRLNFLLPFALSGQSDHTMDARRVDTRDLPENMREGFLANALRTLQEDYDFVGIIDEHMFQTNLRTILKALPAQVPVVLLQANASLRDSLHEITHTSNDVLKFNEWIADFATETRMTTVLNIRDSIFTEDEVEDWFHFDRIVYHRLFEQISRIRR